MSHTVLVCDDAIFMRTMISDILTQAGFEVVGEAESGVQAVDKYRQLKPDLVTMDIVMPDMGGIEAVREICKTDPDAKILMCSAMGQQALVVEAIQAGAKAFVVKPFQPSRVLAAVQRLLAQEAAHLGGQRGIAHVFAASAHGGDEEALALREGEREGVHDVGEVGVAIEPVARGLVGYREAGLARGDRARGCPYEGGASGAAFRGERGSEHLGAPSNNLLHDTALAACHPLS